MTGIHYSDHVGATVRKNGEVVGYTESARDGTSASSDTASDGAVSRSVLGRSPQNEDRVLLTARILVQRLNSEGAAWEQPELYHEQSSDIDATAVDDTSGDKLTIQVVRADPDTQFWGELGPTGSAERIHRLDDAIEIIRAAIEKKLSVPHRQRADLVLALDATLTPDLIHSAVVSAARAALAPELGPLGFRAIYLVGPEQQHVHRLDA